MSGCKAYQQNERNEIIVTGLVLLEGQSASQAILYALVVCVQIAWQVVSDFPNESEASQADQRRS